MALRIAFSQTLGPLLRRPLPRLCEQVGSTGRLTFSSLARRGSCVGAAVWLAWSGSVFAADVCKWKDEAGRLQFGDCRLAPSTQTARVDARPAAGEAAARTVPAAKPPAAAASVPSIGRWKSKFRPEGGPGVVGWTPTCEKLAQRIMDLKPGTPFQSESNQIMQGCPGLAYHCEFSFERPEINRCGPIAKAPGDALVSKDYIGYPEGARLPTYRDVQAR
jgi:hypothetical protein